MKTDLVIAKVLKPRGLKGEMRVEWYVSDQDQVSKLKKVKIDNIEYTVRHVSLDGVFGYIALDGIDNIDLAESLRGKEISAQRKHLKLEEGKYYIVDMIGLNLYVGGELFGEVTSVMQYGSADVYNIKTASGSCSFPAIPNLITEVNIEKGYIKVNDRLFSRVVVFN